MAPSLALCGEVELERVELERVELERVDEQRVDEQRLYFYNSFCFLEFLPSISLAISRPTISLAVFNSFIFSFLISFI